MLPYIQGDLPSCSEQIHPTRFIGPRGALIFHARYPWPTSGQLSDEYEAVKIPNDRVNIMLWKYQMILLEFNEELLLIIASERMPQK